MLPAALRGELGTFPTSAAGLPAAPLRSAALPARSLLSGSSAHAPSAGGSREPARVCPLGRVGCRRAERGEARCCGTPAGSAACSNRPAEPCPDTAVPRTHTGRGSLCTRAPAPIALLSPTPCTQREPPPLRRAHTHTHAHARTERCSEGKETPLRGSDPAAAPARWEELRRRYLSRREPRGAHAAAARREVPSGAVRAAGPRCRAGRRGAAMGRPQLQVRSRAQPRRGHPAPLRTAPGCAPRLRKGKEGKEPPSPPAPPRLFWRLPPSPALKQK